jgi:hypothetical protein
VKGIADEQRAGEAGAYAALLGLATRDSALLRAQRIAVLQRLAGNRAVAALVGRAATRRASTASGRWTDPTTGTPITRSRRRGHDVQRRKEPGEGSEEGGVLLDEGPAPLTPKERLSGAHWKKIADDRWGGATPSISELEASFAADLQAFLDMLKANHIDYKLQSGYRPPQRSYLFHYCVLVAKGKIAPRAVPPMDGVDIIWDHGNVAASRKGAADLAAAFGLVGVAAHPSNHNSGKAVDMAFDFSANPTNTITYVRKGKTITRKLKIGDEAIVGRSSRGRSISNIGSRALSKAGADFGVHRALDNDIVHWSRSGR